MKKIAFCSVLDPNKGGFGIHTINIANKLCETYEITVISEDSFEHVKYFADDKIKHIQVKEKIDYTKVVSGFDLYLINVANNVPHNFCANIFSLVEKKVTIVHDQQLMFSLSHYDVVYELFFPNKKFRSNLLELEYICDQFSHEDLANYKNTFLSNYNFYNIYMIHNIRFNQYIVKKSDGLIVHSEFAKFEFAKYNDNITYAPLYPNFTESVYKNVSNTDKAVLREKYGFKPDEIIVSLFGFASRYKRVIEIIKAMEIVSKQIPNFKLVIAGKCEDFFIKLTAMDSSIKNKITFYNEVLPEEKMAEMIKSSDVILNLRYPTVGESSGVAYQSMCFGVCTVVNDYSSFAEFDDEIVYKIPIYENGKSDDAIISEYLIKLLQDQELIKKTGQNALKYVKALSIDKTISAYKKAIEKVI